MATRSTKLTIAATTLIVVGLIETALLVYAILRGTGFSGGSLFYCYAGYKLLKRSTSIYRYVAGALWIFLALLLAAAASIVI